MMLFKKKKPAAPIVELLLQFKEEDSLVTTTVSLARDIPFEVRLALERTHKRARNSRSFEFTAQEPCMMSFQAVGHLPNRTTIDNMRSLLIEHSLADQIEIAAALHGDRPEVTMIVKGSSPAIVRFIDMRCEAFWTEDAR